MHLRLDRVGDIAGDKFIAALLNAAQCAVHGSKGRMATQGQKARHEA
jgi:hypothetical protein